VTPALPHPAPPMTQVLVLPGHAALIRDSGSDAATATCHLLTDSGIRYQLVGAAAAQLGYEGVACTEVPGDWLRLIPAGPALDPVRAREPVTPGVADPSGISGQTTDPPIPPGA
jgi:hypothetical protein